jgi:hypothetical protein
MKKKEEPTDSPLPLIIETPALVAKPDLGSQRN